MIDPPTDEELEQVAELCRRIEAKQLQEQKKTEPKIPGYLYRGKGRNRTAPPRDGLAYVTLKKKEWASLVDVIGPCGEPNLRACRDAIVTVCNATPGDRETEVTLWHPVTGFQALTNAVDRNPRGCAASGKVCAQVYLTSGD